ncbi:MAG: outer membrane beta-barrel protein [Candidatus Methylacidiphilales bacterium]|nr:outer membrane beta-barrel protein [Candidatus Methylacidiphilales bacterium]
MNFRKVPFIAAGLILGMVVSLEAQQVAPPPAPRPWHADTAPTPTTSTSEPKTEPNGSRLKVSSAAAEEAEAAQKPRFNVDAPLRDRSGYYIGASLGANIAQDNDVNAPGLSLSGDIAPVGGLKLGYVYPFDNEPIEQFQTETGGIGLRLAGALEAEVFYLRNESEATIGGVARDFSIDAGYFMFNAFLKAKVGKAGFYAGPGVGIALTHTSGSAINGDQDEANLAYQMVGGAEYLFHPDWAVFAEYKWLITDDFDLDMNGAGQTDFGMFEQHLFSLGIKRLF